MTKKREAIKETLKVVEGTEAVVEAISVEREEEAEQLVETFEPIADVVGQPEPEAETMINWTEGHGRHRIPRQTIAKEMEGLVIGEGIGSPYYVILSGKRRLLPSIAVAMGFGAVKFLRPEEIAKIPEGEPYQS